MLTDDEKWELAGNRPAQKCEADTQSHELEVAKQRVNAYRGCGHPVMATAIWLLGEVQRLAGVEAERDSALAKVESLTKAELDRQRRAFVASATMLAIDIGDDDADT